MYAGILVRKSNANHPQHEDWFYMYTSVSDAGSKRMESLFDCRDVRPQACFAGLEKNVFSCRGSDPLSVLPRNRCTPGA